MSPSHSAKPKRLRLWVSVMLSLFGGVVATSEICAEGASPGWLGISAEPAASGLRVRHVTPTSPAQAAGLADGDVVLSIAGTRTTDGTSFSEALRAAGAGNTVSIEGLRGSQPLQLHALLQSVPDEPALFQKELVGRRVPTPSRLVTSQGALDLGKTGSVTVIELFSVYCKPCKDLAAHTQSLYEQTRDRGLRVIAITDDELGEADAWAAKHHLSFTIASDAAQNSLETFHATSLPATIVVDKQGTVRGAWLGYSSYHADQIDALAKQLIAQ